MKRYLYGLMLCQCMLYGEIDFSQHQIKNGETLFEVTSVAEDDVLNVRAKPTHKSDIRYKLAPHAQNIISYEKNMAAKVGKNIWVPVRVGFDDGFLDGYVNAKYLKFAEKFETIENQRLSVRVPYFMEYETPQSEPDWIRVFHSLSVNHYSGCDERDNPRLEYQLVDFEIALNVYDTLSEALMKILYIDSQNFTDYYDPTHDWFRPNPKELVEAVNYYGLEGYSYTMGAEGCGETVYFFQRNGKVLVIKEPFDHNPPILQKGESLPSNWRYRDKKEILNDIVQHLQIN